MLIAILTGIIVLITYQIYLKIYFSSDDFLKIKQSISDHTKNCNELNHHIQELKNAFIDANQLDYGVSELSDNSIYNFKRREWDKSVKNSFVHNCSLSVCKNASEQPFKYLCKYFGFSADEQTLCTFETVLNDFDAAEQGKTLLKEERDEIISGIEKSIPGIIFRFSQAKLIERLGFERIDFSTMYYPVFTFQYVSAGGNSSAKCDIVLSVDNLNRFIGYLSSIIKFRKSIAGQRALMTSSLREKIKMRDNYSCKICGISTYQQSHLLLEIDHIVPLARGGETTENNLQTLCWKCNRSKGSKII